MCRLKESNPVFLRFSYTLQMSLYLCNNLYIPTTNKTPMLSELDETVKPLRNLKITNTTQ